MKLKNSIWLLVVAASLFGLNSCYETKMDWSDPYKHIPREELPLEVQEKIALYEDLLVYSQKIGVAIDFNTFMNDPDYAEVVKKNFAQAVAGNEMKQENLLSAQGAYTWGNTDATIAALKEAGLSVYGHTLVWHQQAQAQYYNYQIRDIVIPPPPGANMIDGSFETGLGDWEAQYYKEAFTVVEIGEDATDGTHALQLVVSNDGVGDKYNRNINSPTFSIVQGHRYQISFFIKSDVEGAVGLDLSSANLGNQYPNGPEGELAVTGPAWKQVIYNTEISGEGSFVATASGDINCRLLLGKVGGVTYLIDDVQIIDLDAVVGEVNLLENGDIETGDLTGWSVKNAGDGVTASEDAKHGGSWGIKAISTATSANEWDLQFNSTVSNLDPEKTYTLSFWVKSDIAGQARISFGAPGIKTAPDANANQYPWMDWYRTGGGATALFNTTGDWAMVSIDMMPVENSTGAVAFNMDFDFGKVPGVTYFIDDVKLVDRDAAPALVNLLENGDFEAGDLSSWTAKNPAPADNPDNITVQAAAKRSGDWGLQAIATATSANEWDLQFNSTVSNLDPEKTYTLSFWVKSDIAGQGRISFGAPGIKTAPDANANQYPWMDWYRTGGGATALFNTDSNWAQVSIDMMPVENSTGAVAFNMDFDFGKVPGVTYFIDDVMLVEKPAEEPAPAASFGRDAAQAGPTVIPLTMEQKQEILAPLFVKYITDVADHYKGKVDAWEVLNEPMTGEGGVNLGEETLGVAGTKNFYWGYYFGKDYGVTAFKTAAAADPDAKLFINDFNLERISGKSKLQGLINYVKYIEDNGGRVDGIGTQMHININDYDGSDEPTKDITKASIEEMFTLLAATGKLIKVTELDIAMDASSVAGEGPGVDAPISLSVAQQQSQAELFEFVARAYFSIIPEAQQYGLTIWGVSDRADQHAYWLPGDAPFLFDADYNRKWAYKGLVDGIMGEDVSASWTLTDLPGGDLPGMGD